MKGSEEAEAGGSPRRAGAGDGGRNPRTAAPGASEPPSGRDKPVAQDQQLIEELIERDNLNRAWKQVRRNRGSPGVDGRDLNQAQAYVKEHWNEIEAHLLAGTYRPKCHFAVSSTPPFRESRAAKRSAPRSVRALGDLGNQHDDKRGDEKFGDDACHGMR